MIEILHEIQRKLKAPKDQNNDFGGYKYRSCEDILQAVKPLLPDGTALFLSDDIVQMGDRFYVKATASLQRQDNKIEVSAFAREALSKKGMDEAQITGACSSYARKYALNGLFAIDDTKDADATNRHEEKEPREVSRDDKVFQRDFIYRLGQTQNDDEITSLVDELGDQFHSLPDYINGQISDAVTMKRQQFKNGVKSVPHRFGFIDVKEAVEFATLAKEKIDNLDPAELYEWVREEDFRLKGIDAMLKAEKYKKEGKTTYQRLLDAYNKKMPAAAE